MTCSIALHHLLLMTELEWRKNFHLLDINGKHYNIFFSFLFSFMHFNFICVSHSPCQGRGGRGVAGWRGGEISLLIILKRVIFFVYPDMDCMQKGCVNVNEFSPLSLMHSFYVSL